MLVCTECKNPGCCTSHEGEARAIYCSATPDTLPRIWIIPVWREYIHGDQLYADPQGEPYTGLNNFIQTPIHDPVRPRTAAELLQEAQQKHKLCNEK